MTKRLLVAVQMWDGDRAAAFSLMRLLADIAPEGKYHEADLLIAVRFDCPFDVVSVYPIARAFRNTLTFRSTTRLKGWPQGCNAVSSDTYRYFVQRCASGVWNYSGILFLESDCIPTSRDWLSRIVTEWAACQRPILGYLRPGPDGTPDHCNAACVLGTPLAQMEPGFIRSSVECGWDWYHRAFMLRHAAPSREIFMDYRTPETNIDVLFAPRSYAGKHPLASQPPHVPAILHGPKEWQMVHPLVRERLLGSPALSKSSG